jgi:hypothetical protein
MFIRSLSILAAIVAIAAVAASNVRAQPSRSSELPLAVTLASIKEAILKATGAQSEIIELSATEKVFTVKVVNGKFADGTTAGRESEAGTIEAIVATAIPGKAQFKAIIVIVVQYLKRRNGSSRVVDSIEFRKDVIGAFRHHVT